MPFYSAAKKYSDAGRVDAVVKKKPEELIALLLQKACVSVRRAILVITSEELDNKSWEVRIQANERFQLSISKALQIITALREILDHEKGGEVSHQLEETYTSIMATLWKCSKEKDAVGMEKILRALTELKEAWETVSGSSPTAEGRLSAESL